MSSDFIKKEKYSIEDLLEIMSLLRSENGCPWDKEQTHESLRKNLLEESHEVIEAIDTNDMEHLKEELGDLLFVVVNLCRRRKVDPELALFNANRKFERRFNAVEAAVKAQGKDLLTASVASYRAIDAWNTDPVMSEESFNRLQTVMTEAGELTKTADYDKVVNNTFAENVK